MEEKNMEMDEFNEKSMSVEQKSAYDALTREKFAKRIVMGDVPPKTKAEFVKWADGEYSGNYGFALKFLWDFYVNAKRFEDSMIMRNIGETKEEKEDE